MEHIPSPPGLQGSQRRICERLLYWMESNQLLAPEITPDKVMDSFAQSEEARAEWNRGASR